MRKHEAEVFRPGFGVGLTVAVGVICALGAVYGLVDAGPTALIELWPWLGLLAGACWATFYNPRVDVDEAGVRLVNVWHTVEVPWAALVGLDTRWAMTLVTADDRRMRAWAAPAPGRASLRNDERPATHGLREAAIGGEIRPGDLPDTDSGRAAALVRKHWRAHVESLDNDMDERPRAYRSFHWIQLAVAVCLAAGAVVGLA